MATIHLPDDLAEKLKNRAKQAQLSIDTIVQSALLSDQENTDVINAFPSILCTVSADGIFQSISENFTSILGYTLSELTARPFITFVHPDDVDATLAEFEKLQGGQPLLYFENRYQAKDGRYVWISWQANPMNDNGMIYAIAQDVTQRKLTEEVLYFIAQTRWGANSKRDFLNDMVLYLSELLSIDYAFVGELDGDHVHTLAIAHHGNLQDNMTYAITDTPCQHTFEQGEAFYSNNLQARFPNDEILQTWGVNSYYGVALSDTTGKHIGAIVLMDANPIIDKQHLERVIQLVAMRAAHYVETLQQQRAMEKSEARYQSVVTALTEGVVLQSKTGEIIANNKSAERILGLTAEQLRGLSSVDPRWRSIHPDGSPFPGEDHPAMVTLRTGEPQHNVMMGVHKPSGELTWISVNSEPLIDAKTGSPYAVVASFNDITALQLAKQQIQETEARSQILMKHAPVAIFVVDEQQMIVQHNDQARTLFGYTDVEFVKMPLIRLMPQRFHHAHTDHVNDFFGHPQSRDMTSDTGLFARRKDGREFPIDAGLSYFEYNNERFAIAFVSDVSARIQAEENRKTTELLQIELEKEKELRELKSRFLSMVSHEFRTPMSVILTSSGLLRAKWDRMTPEQRTERFDKIENQVHRLDRLINDVTAISKSELLKQQLTLEPIVLPVFLKQLSDEILLAYNSTITIEITQSALNLRPVMLDEMLAHQMFGNLLSNAVKYSPNGQKVTVHLHYTDNTATITIEDDGIGIPQDDQKYLFEVFNRASNVGGISGSGLGLVIVKQAVEAHGGSLTFESDEGEGTTFHITLPIVPPTH